MTAGELNSKQRRTLVMVFETPPRSNVLWSDVEALLLALGAQISQGRGSRVRVLLNDVAAVFHRPHPKKETEKGALRSVRTFLERAGVKP